MNDSTQNTQRQVWRHFKCHITETWCGWSSRQVSLQCEIEKNKSNEEFDLHSRITHHLFLSKVLRCHFNRACCGSAAEGPDAVGLSTTASAVAKLLAACVFDRCRLAEVPQQLKATPAQCAHAHGLMILHSLSVQLTI